MGMYPNGTAGNVGRRRGGERSVGELNLRWPVWVGVVSDDLEGQRRFYREVLGFEELEAGADWIEFDLGSGRILELLKKDPGTPQYAEPACVVGFEVDDIQAAVRELEAREVERVSEIEGGSESTQYWCYFRDGEGHLFEIAQKA
jgi:catechol 2,3-dioxygenase-like lactoylglutathione lyase family enzyme